MASGWVSGPLFIAGGVISLRAFGGSSVLSINDRMYEHS